MSPKEYDDIPVECCKNCLSIDMIEDVEFDGKHVGVCPHCGSSETMVLLIEEWDELFVRKYNLGRYINLPSGMTWEEIMQHENKETYEDECIKREIRCELLNNVNCLKKEKKE